jgi:hypothetical protein|eukprot:2721695-Prymnesium_polylepis.2
MRRQPIEQTASANGQRQGRKSFVFVFCFGPSGLAQYGAICMASTGRKRRPDAADRRRSRLAFLYPGTAMYII